MRNILFFTALFSGALFGNIEELLVAIQEDRTDLAKTLVEEVSAEALNSERLPIGPKMFYKWVTSTTNCHGTFFHNHFKFVGQEGYNALELAIDRENSEMVEILLKKGADPFIERKGYLLGDKHNDSYIVKEQIYFEMTPLSLAIDKNDPHLVQLLLDHKKDLGQPVFTSGKMSIKGEKFHYQLKTRQNAIQYARDEEIFTGLSDQEIEAGKKGDPILVALEEEGLAMVDLFFQRGQIYAPRYLDAALACESDDFLAYLLESGFVTWREAAERALETLKYEKAKMLWENSYQEALEVAVLTKNEPMVLFFISENAPLGKAFERAFDLRWAKVLEEFLVSYGEEAVAVLQMLKEKLPFVLEEVAASTNYEMAKFLVREGFPLANSVQIAYKTDNKKMLDILLG